jgi:phosphatidylglycerol:prolipoprotein diacylglycerol transferase
MIDPIAFTIPIINFPVRWYALLMVGGIYLAAWLTAVEVRRRGEDPEHVWGALIWAMPAGIVGARLWYVANDILGGGTVYLRSPLRILNTLEGGLHFYGAMLFGAVAVILYVRRHRLDVTLFLDAVAPTLLIAQAVVRPANFINQELYGQPTNLPWGIRISASHRLAPWNDMVAYPEDTTRFHPTFAYEMIWNFAAAAVLIWLARRYPRRVRPGSVFAGWLLLEGVGRVIIESFRPDQPVVPGTAISYTRIVAILMALAGGAYLLLRYDVLKLPGVRMGPLEYTVSRQDEPQTS